MAVIPGAIGRLAHDTATVLIDRQITKTLASAVTDVVTTGFGLVDELLKVVQDLTAPPPAAPPAQPKPGGQP